MKKLLFLLLLVPVGISAQESKKWEVGLNTAAVFTRMYGNWQMYDYYFLANHVSLSAYHNFNRIQVGLRVDGGPKTRFDWWLSPQAVANYKIPLGKLDVYGGGVVGFVREHQKAYSTYSARGESGLMTGVQAGLVYYPGKRIGINLEPAVRFQRMYHTVKVVNYNVPGGPVYTERKGFTKTYFPLSLGVRYRFN